MFAIPYGIPSVAADWVAPGRDGGTYATPYVLIDESEGQVLRLNGAQYAFPEAPDLRAMTDAPAQLEFLRGHLAGFCDLWRRPPKLFLDRYFDFVATQVERSQKPLAQSLEKFGTLFRYRDWCLSAPRPLPRAWIRAPREDGDFYTADFIFWLGGRLLAVVIAGSATPTKTEQARDAMFDASGVEMLTLSAHALATDGVAYLSECLPSEDFDRFWAGEALPSSPFRGSSLGEIVAP